MVSRNRPCKSPTVVWELNKAYVRLVQRSQKIGFLDTFVRAAGLQKDFFGLCLHSWLMPRPCPPSSGLIFAQNQLRILEQTPKLSPSMLGCGGLFTRMGMVRFLSGEPMEPRTPSDHQPAIALSPKSRTLHPVLQTLNYP